MACKAGPSDCSASMGAVDGQKTQRLSSGLLLLGKMLVACAGVALLVLASDCDRGRSAQASLRRMDTAVSSNLPECAPERLLVLNDANVANNNLGGHGPGGGDESITIKNVLPHSGRNVDLQIVVDTPPTSGWKHTYVPEEVSENGVDLGLGQVNLRSGTEVNLRFRFLDGLTGQSVRVDSFLLSFFDMKTSSGLDGRMQVTAGGVQKYFLSANSMLGVAMPDYGAFEIQPRKGGTLTSARAQDESRMVSFLFPASTDAALTLSVTQGGAGHTFMFSGASPLTCPSLPLGF